MNYVLSLSNGESEGKKILVGWYETVNDYRSFWLYENGDIEWKEQTEKSPDKTRSIVLGQINKFNPHIIFFKAPIEAEYLDYNELKDKAI